MAIADELREAPVALRNVLFAMDFSADSLRAFPFALGIGLHYGGKIFVAHVVPDDTADLLPLDQRAAIDKVLEASVEAALNSPAEALRSVPHEILVDHGQVCARLLTAAESCKIDLIVIGEHGWHGIKKLLKGSTAQEMTCLATRPVLSIGPRVPGPREFKTIRYVTDCRPASLRALTYALSLAEKYRAELIVLHVNDGEGPELPAQARPKASDFFRDYLAGSTANLLRKPNVIVDFGPPAELILECAVREGADLIVMGMNHLGGLRARIASHLPGSTAYEVISGAHCPVLTVPLTKQNHQNKRLSH